MNRILIILMGALGDVVRGFSVLAPIKERWPECKITWVVEPKCQEIVRLHPLIDEVIVFQRAGGLSSLLPLRRELRSKRYDCVLDMQRHFKSGIFSLMSGSTTRIGFHPRDAKEFNWIFNSRYIRRESDRVSKVIHYQHFLEPLGIERPERVDFGLARLNLTDDLPPQLRTGAQGVVGLVMGSSWVSKNWPLGGYNKLLESLTQRPSLRVVLLGDKTQQENGQKLAARFEGVLDFTGKTSLRQLLAIIQRSVVCVGPDSGPGHIAAALHRPYIGLFGPTRPERVAPFGSEALAIKTSVGCAGCFRRTCPGVGNICMKLISPQEVMERIDEVLSDKVLPI